MLRSTDRSCLGKSSQRGFLLIEALIALLIFSMGLITLMGLQSLSIQNGIQGKYRTDASYLANAISAQMLADKNNLNSYSDGAATPSAFKTAWLSEVVTRLPGGAGSVVVAGGVATIVVGWQAPGDTSSHRYRMVSQIVF